MKTLLLTGGTWPDDERAMSLYHAADYVICCDGAAHNAVRLGMVPHMLIGDMDSISVQDRHDLLSQGTKETALPMEKDETDTQSACNVAIALGAQKVVIVGGLGGRLDHTLGNIHCLWMLHLEGIEARMESGREVAHIVTEKISLGRYKGYTFSLIPLIQQTEVFRMTGVKYPLVHTPLMLGSTLGISNIVVQQDALLSMQSGTALLLVNLTEEHS